MSRLILKLSFLLFFITDLAFSQPKVTEEQKTEFLKDLVYSFENEYLWEQEGTEIAKFLRTKINNDGYTKINDPEIFVETLNRDLFLWSKDLHLKIDLYYPLNTEPTEVSASPEYSIFKKELIIDGVYYLKFDTFPDLNPSFKKEAEDVISSLENPDTIIIDLRDNIGGSDETVNYLAGYFFEKKTKLSTSYQWNNQAQEIWASPKLQSSFLSETKLIILTSQSTFSAAEIFTQRLQSFERAIVIGESTPGAAHRTATYLMSDVFLLHWPYERSVHAKTNQDLEGIGIKPNYLTHYNTAKKFAIEFTKNAQFPEYDGIKVPEKTKLVKVFLDALNSKQIDNVFISKHIVSDNKKEVLNTLNKFNTVWNHHLNAELTNIHYLDGDDFRIFLKTSYATMQIKVNVIDNKIQKIMYR